MGNSTIDSNLVGDAGTETITNFATIGDSSAALVGATLTSSGAVAGTTGTFTDTLAGGGAHIQVGDHKYIVFGELSVEASVEAAMTAVDASCKGSLYSGQDSLWFFKSDTGASALTGK